MQRLRNLVSQIFDFLESGTISVFITLIFLGMFIAIISAWIASNPSIPPLFSLLQELEIWHRLFTGRTTLKGKVTLENSDKATRAGEGLINDLIRDASNQEVPNMVHRLPANFMPGYYLFFTRERAIIVAPLFLPFPIKL